ncbi:flagellar export chaperone FliS [Thalassotalea marina]|uniref:Flagellar secretion chaperone FliS n=1 Tax=Thalassotalea marina TaxID=1673741 RepID=A0A919BBB2_9GAMM|nr:flagellar export chaperone FliS [Thalassotalea marina]GHF80298.1 flagellar protein FliS [Thalassotalea marina]
MRQNIKAYKSVNIESSILSADPHQIIVMMFDGALESVVIAKGAIERKELALKSTALTKAVNILTALKNALDPEAAPAIAENFGFLYDYCITKLNDASISLDIAALDEVHGLLKPLRDAWREMPEQSKQEGLSLLDQKNAKASASA